MTDRNPRLEELRKVVARLDILEHEIRKCREDVESLSRISEGLIKASEILNDRQMAIAKHLGIYKERSK